MARGDLLCPIDSLPMLLPIWTTRGDGARDGGIGAHMHLSIDQNALVCANLHQWRFQGEVTMERTG